MSEVWAVLGWWIIIQAFGLAAWPLAFRLLRWLPDRGYMLAKPLGLLLTSYFFWLAVSFRILPNTSIGPLAVKSYAAVQWLDQNISGAPIVLQGMREEAQYQSSLARISSWSGLPTLLGWPSHEVQWRGSSDVLIRPQRWPCCINITSNMFTSVALNASNIRPKVWLSSTG